MVTRVNADGSLALTDLEVDALATMLNAGDRGAFHYSYYRMSGTVDSLLTAKIATFSETVGGTAYASNWYLAEQYGQNGFSTDPVASEYKGIYYLSQLVAQTVLQNVQVDLQSGGDGFLNDTEHFQSATQAWAIAGNPEQFPGLFLDGANPFFNGGTGAGFLDILNQTDPDPGITASRFGIYYADTTGKELSDFQGVAGYTTIQNDDASIVTDAAGRVVGVFNNFPTVNDGLAVAANLGSQAVNFFTISTEVRENFMSGLISGDLTGRVEKDGDLAEVVEARRGFSEFSGTYDGDPDPALEYTYTIPSLSFRAAATAGDDILTAPLGGGTVNANAGDDVVFGDSGIEILGVLVGGTDSIDGGSGNDVIWGFDGDDTLIGGAGDDVVRGGEGDDEIEGTSGSNILDGGAGDDTIIGGTGIDSVIGGAGTDEFIDNDTAADVLLSSIEKITQGEGSDGSGDVGGLLDDLFGGGLFQFAAPFSFAATLSEAEDNEPRGNTNLSDAIADGRATIDVDLYNNFALDAGPDGNVDFAIANFNWGDFGFYLEAGREDVATVGSLENDRLNGSSHDDLIVGGAGNDVLKGYRGDDELSGEQGNDRIIAGSGNDHLYGDRGEDVLSAGRGNDRLWGGADDDLLYGGSGADSLSGGFGDDLVSGGWGNDLLIGGNGADDLFGGAGRDVADYSRSSEAVEVTLATNHWWSGHSRLGTGTGGEAEGDRLFSIEDLVGSEYDDVLSGSRSANRLDGGSGNDELTGGAGRDTFVFATGSGEDTITDFDTGLGGWFHRFYLKDVVEIDVEGFETYQDVLDVALQTSDDVTIDFGSGDILRLENVTISDLSHGDFLFA